MANLALTNPLTKTNKNENNMKGIEVNLKGRIGKYFFGALRVDYFSEMQEALQFCTEDVNTVSSLASLIFRLSLDNLNDPFEALYNGISRKNLEKFPKLTELVDWIKKEECGHYPVIEDMFEYASQNSEKSIVSFYENDATITVTVNGEKLIVEQKLGEFAESSGEGNIEDNIDSQEYKSLKSLIENNADFGFSSLEDFYGWDINKQGAMFINDWFRPKELVDFVDNTDKERQVTIYFDDITDWTFYAKDEEFNFKNLTFTAYSCAEDFRQSRCETIFNYLFYKGKLMDKEEKWAGDKGITLTIGDERGMDKLSFLING